MKIVSVITKDNITLHGVINDKNRSNSIFLHTHGTGSSFYMEGFEDVIMGSLAEKCVDSLFVNNRGAYLLEAWQPTGAGVERFEDSILDINAWINFAVNEGYSEIILSGHSLGSEKVAYYMQFGEFKNKIVRLFLLGFSDTYGSQKRYENRLSVNYTDEAKELVSKNLGNVFLANGSNTHSGELPVSAGTYLDFYKEDSQFFKALPFHSKNLSHLNSVRIPVIGIIGDREDEEWTIVSIDESIDILSKTFASFKGYKILDCGHTFENKHKELTDIILNNI